MKLTIRFALMRERLTLIELQRRASLVWPDYRDALLANPDSIDIPVEQFRRRQVRIAELAAGPAGFSATLPVDGAYCELDGLFVEPALWRRGIGRALIEDVAAGAPAPIPQHGSDCQSPRGCVLPGPRFY
ncbi:MAG TPA: GNAT family N-acetyltransferase [Rhizomicrobium sp.]